MATASQTPENPDSELRKSLYGSPDATPATVFGDASASANQAENKPNGNQIDLRARGAIVKAYEKLPDTTRQWTEANDFVRKIVTGQIILASGNKEQMSRLEQISNGNAKEFKDLQEIDALYQKELQGGDQLRMPRIAEEALDATNILRRFYEIRIRLTKQLQDHLDLAEQIRQAMEKLVPLQELSNIDVATHWLANVVARRGLIKNVTLGLAKLPGLRGKEVVDNTARDLRRDDQVSRFLQAIGLPTINSIAHFEFVLDRLNQGGLDRGGTTSDRLKFLSKEQKRDLIVLAHYLRDEGIISGLDETVFGYPKNEEAEFRNKVAQVEKFMDQDTTSDFVPTRKMAKYDKTAVLAYFADQKKNLDILFGAKYFPHKTEDIIRPITRAPEVNGVNRSLEPSAVQWYLDRLGNGYTAEMVNKTDVRLAPEAVKIMERAVKNGKRLPQLTEEVYVLSVLNENQKPPSSPPHLKQLREYVDKFMPVATQEEPAVETEAEEEAPAEPAPNENGHGPEPVATQPPAAAETTQVAQTTARHPVAAPAQPGQTDSLLRRVQGARGVAGASTSGGPLRRPPPEIDTRI